MTRELTQIVNLVNSKNEKIENICYKEVHKLKLVRKIAITALFLILKVL